MLSKDIIKFTENAEHYAQAVMLALAKDMGDQAAAFRVVQRLSLVLQAMAEATPPEEFAAALAPH